MPHVRALSRGLVLPVLVTALALPGARTVQADSTPVPSAVPADPGTARPVDPRVTSVPLHGVDRAAQAASVPRVAPGGHGAPGASMVRDSARAAVLTAPAATSPFQTLGVTWRPSQAPPDLVVAVRTRAATTSRWTPWTPLDLDDDDATPDPVTATGLTVAQATKAGLRGGTGSLWAGPSTGVQVRVVVASGTLPKDLRLELIDPGTTATATATASPAATAVPPLGTAASGGLSEPLIYSRSAWGADESKVRNAPIYMPEIKAAVMHHTAGPNNYARSQVPGIIRGDYAYHLKRGWSDIGYNALVDRFGRIWEGRAGGLTRNVMGAHAGGFNSDTFGVSVIGNYDVARPSAASVEAVARVFAWKLDVNHRDPAGSTRLTSAGGGTARWKAGTTVTLPVVMGHRNTGQTACPGRYLYPYLQHIRARITTLMKAALINPSHSPSTTTTGSPLWISARALARQSWSLTVTSGCSGATVAQASGRAGAGRSFTARWDGLLAGGTPAPPGDYTLTLASRAGSAVARPVTTTIQVQPPAVPDPAAGTPSSGSGGYQAVTPAPLTGAGGSTTLFTAPRSRIDLPVLGQAGVPAIGVTAVVLNVTATCATDPATLEAWPTGGTRPGQPFTSVTPGTTQSALVTTPVGANGSVSLITSAGVVRLTADVVGYYTAAGARLRAVPTTRVLETALTGGPLGAGAARTITLPAAIGGVPVADVTAVLASISAVNPAGSGTLSAYGAGGSAPRPALTFRAGRSIDNLAIVPVSAGAIAVRAAGGPTNVTIDVRGIVTGAAVSGYGLSAISPVTVMNVKSLAAGSPRTVTVAGGSTGVPANATGVLVGLTATSPAASGSIEVYPAGTAPAPGAALRLTRGISRGTQVLVPVGAGGKVTLKIGAGHSGVRLDVRGYLS